MSQPSTRPPLRIATRQSPLALWQAEHVAVLLNNLGFPTELVPLISSGDVDMRPIDSASQVGMFTKRIQQALLDGEADIAVHSLKDLPTQNDPALVVAAIPEREIVFDCLVSQEKYTIESLPQAATVGTGSCRRAAQLRHRRPDLKVLPIRGNVQTRLGKLFDKEFDAIMLAAAGLTRMAMDDVPRVVLTLEDMLPAPGQGALAIEVRRSDTDVLSITTQLNDLETAMAVTAERTLLAELNGGCLAPIAAHCQLLEEKLLLRAAVLSVDGRERLDEEQSTSWDRDHWHSCAMELALQTAKRLSERGASELIRSS